MWFKKEETYEQLDLFTDYETKRQEQVEEERILEREKRMQQVMLQIKKKYGKNAILKGMNRLDTSSMRQSVKI